ncbi:MAG: response regulator, partial [Gemmatimonadota bacterium]
MVGRPIRVLHVEDSPGDARLLREALKGGRLAFEIECADTMVGGLERLAAGGWDVVLLDLALPDSSGLESVSRVRAASADVPIVVLTGLEDEALGLAAVQGGADDYLVKGEVKPALGSMIQRSVRHSLERRRLRVQLETRERQQRAAAELERCALDGCELEDLFSRAVETVRQVLGVEYAKVLELSLD